MAEIENYGGTFNATQSELTGFGRIKLWHDVTETFPGGATLLPSDDCPVGTKIPGGTPVTVKDNVPGGEGTLNGATPTGLNKDDRWMGSDGCTLTVVTEGQIYAKRTEATITEAQKTYLKGQIKFINA